METLAGGISDDEGVTVMVSRGPLYTYLASSLTLSGLWSSAAPGSSASSCLWWGIRLLDPYAEPPLCHLPSWTKFLS